jgi:hypothetical protein
MYKPPAKKIECLCKSLPALAAGLLFLLIIFEFPLYSAAEGFAGDPGENTRSRRDRDTPRATIRNIHIEIKDVYDPEEKILWLIPRNALHWQTTESTVRRWLPFAEGDVFCPRLMARVAQTLKDTGRLNVNIYNTPPTEDGFVDISIHVQDLWSLYSDNTRELTGGIGLLSLTVGESNFLGRHATLEIHVERDNFFTRLHQRYEDPWFLDSRWHFSERTGIQYDLDGNLVGGNVLINLNRPIRKRDDILGWETTFVYDDELIYKHTGGTIDKVTLPSGEFEKIYHRKSISLKNMLSYPLKGRESTEDGEVNLGVFVLNKQNTYQAYDPLVFDDEDFRKEVMKDDFSRHKIGLLFETKNHGTVANLSNFQHYWNTEYLSLGNSLRATIAASQNFWGSDENAVYLTLGLTNTSLLTANQIIQASFHYTSDFVTGEGQRNMITTICYTHHFRGLPLGQLVFRAEAAFGERLDNESILTLGADTGLRGYEADRFEGDRRLLFNMEYRLPPLFRIPLLGKHASFVVFTDVGSCWYNHEYRLRDIRMYPGAGIGIRLSSPVASNSITRLDFTTNFGNDKRTFGSVFTFTTGHAF